MIDRNEVICTITWTVEDLIRVLEDEGQEPTEGLIRHLLDETRMKKALQDQSTEDGWEILSTLC